LTHRAHAFSGVNNVHKPLRFNSRSRPVTQQVEWAHNDCKIHGGKKPNLIWCRRSATWSSCHAIRNGRFKRLLSINTDLIRSLVVAVTRNDLRSKVQSTSVGTDLYPHMPILRVASSLGESASARPRPRGRALIRPIWVRLGSGRFVRFWVSGEAKFLKMWDSLARTPMNQSAKFDVASFILCGENLNRTNCIHTQMTKLQTNSKRYIRILPIGMCG